MTFEIDNIELNFSNKRILNGVYLKAELGKTTAIVGRNGSGKSCLLQIIFGSLTPKYKLLRIDNKPVLKPLYQTRLVGFLPQHNFVPNHLKVAQAFKLLNVEWEAFIHLFRNFSKYEHTRIHLLSGGERRVIETYLILKGTHKIVLLDEPFSHIAPIYIAQITTLIAEEKRKKVIIITDHMYTHIIDTADSIYLLNNGDTKLISNLKDLEDYNYLSPGSLE